MSEKLYSIYSTDSYFCTNCNQGWKDNKWMMCCKGCVGHKNMGWSLEDMRQIYGTAMDAMIIQGLKDIRYYFPLVNRPKCPRRIRYCNAGKYTTKHILQPFAQYALDWRIQQALALEEYRKFKSPTTWDRLDPEVQRQLCMKINLKV